MTFHQFIFEAFKNVEGPAHVDQEDLSFSLADHWLDMALEDVANVGSRGDLNLDGLIELLLILEGEYYFREFGSLDVDDMDDASSMECDKRFVIVDPLAIVK